MPASTARSISIRRRILPDQLIGTQANVLVVNLNVPAHSLAELIALAKANRASSTSPRRATAWRRILPANCSRPRPISTSCTFPIRARRGAAGRHRRRRPDDVRHDVRRDGLHQERPGAALGDGAQAHRGLPDIRPWMSSAFAASMPRVARPGRAGRHPQRSSTSSIAPPSKRSRNPGVAKSSVSRRRYRPAIRRRNSRAYIKAEIRNGRGLKASGAHLDE